MFVLLELGLGFLPMYLPYKGSAIAKMARVFLVKLDHGKVENRILDANMWIFMVTYYDVVVP